MDYHTQYIHLFIPSTLPCAETTPTHSPLPSSQIPLVLSLCRLLNGHQNGHWGETRGCDLLWTNDSAKNIVYCQKSQPVLLSFFSLLSTVLGTCGLFNKYIFSRDFFLFCFCNGIFNIKTMLTSEMAFFFSLMSSLYGAIQATLKCITCTFSLCCVLSVF